MTSTEMHAEVDAQFGPLLEACNDPWTAMAISGMWRYEKEYIDTYGARMPKIVNIQRPTSEAL